MSKPIRYTVEPRKQAEACTQCGSYEFGCESVEEKTATVFSFYCKLCLKEMYSFALPSPAAFGLKE